MSSSLTSTRPARPQNRCLGSSHLTGLYSRLVCLCFRLNSVSALPRFCSSCCLSALLQATAFQIASIHTGRLTTSRRRSIAGSHVGLSFAPLFTRKACWPFLLRLEFEQLTVGIPWQMIHSVRQLPVSVYLRWSCSASTTANALDNTAARRPLFAASTARWLSV